MTTTSTLDYAGIHDLGLLAMAEHGDAQAEAILASRIRELGPTTSAPITVKTWFYGIALRGKVISEQVVTRGSDGKLAWSWTGITYRTKRDAYEALERKNVAISLALYA